MKIFENMCNVVDQLQDVCICLVLLVQKFNLEITDGDFGVQGAFPHKLRITDLKLHLRHDALTFEVTNILFFRFASKNVDLQSHTMPSTISVWYHHHIRNAPIKRLKKDPVVNIKNFQQNQVLNINGCLQP